MAFLDGKNSYQIGTGRGTNIKENSRIYEKRSQPSTNGGGDKMRFLGNSNHWPSLFAILALCVLLGLVSGCGGAKKAEFEPDIESIEDARDAINKYVKDPGRKADLLALVAQMEKDLQEMDRVVQKLYADLGRLNDNYNSSPEEFRKAITEFEADRKEVGDRMVDNRFKMIDLSTPEEWKQIAHKKSLRQQTIRQPGE